MSCHNCEGSTLRGEAPAALRDPEKRGGSSCSLREKITHLTHALAPKTRFLQCFPVFSDITASPPPAVVFRTVGSPASTGSLKRCRLNAPPSVPIFHKLLRFPRQAWQSCGLCVLPGTLRCPRRGCPACSSHSTGESPLTPAPAAAPVRERRPRPPPRPPSTGRAAPSGAIRLAVPPGRQPRAEPRRRGHFAAGSSSRRRPARSRAARGHSPPGDRRLPRAAGGASRPSDLAQAGGPGCGRGRRGAGPPSASSPPRPPPAAPRGTAPSARRRTASVTIATSSRTAIGVFNTRQ